MKHRTILLYTLLTVFCTVAFAAAPSIAASNPSILIFPFEVETQGDLAFLQKGVFDILQSRLAAGGGIEVVPYEKYKTLLEGIRDSLKDQEALSIGSRLKAGYVLIGKIRVQSDTSLTDAKLMDVSTGKPALTFSRQGTTPEDVFGHIKTLAAEIRTTLTGGDTTSATLVPKAPAEPPAPKPTAKGSSDDLQYQHPEKLWRGSSELANEPIRSMTSDGRLPVSIWKSPKFKRDFRSIAHGDINGDGKEEIVIASDEALSVYHYLDGKLLLLAEKPCDPDEYLFRVDAADLNRNGRAEIYLSRMLKDRSRLRSQVLEWNGTQLTVLAEPERFLRILPPNTASHEPILLGQESGRGTIFDTRIQRLEWRGNTLEPIGGFAVPFSESVYAFAYADALNAGQDTFVWITPEGFLRLVQQDGEDWKSAERFTGAAAYIPYPTGDEDRGGPSSDTPRKRRYYLPQRILVADIDRDGKNEVLTISNTDLTTHFFPNIRIFRNGRIVCLFWDGMGLGQKWRTSEVSGHISDVLVMDLNGDGKLDMVFSVVSTMSSAFNKAESYLVYWTAD